MPSSDFNGEARKTAAAAAVAALFDGGLANALCGLVGHGNAGPMTVRLRFHNCYTAKVRREHTTCFDSNGEATKGSDSLNAEIHRRVSRTPIPAAIGFGGLRADYDSKGKLIKFQLAPTFRSGECAEAAQVPCDPVTPGPAAGSPIRVTRRPKRYRLRRRYDYQ